MTIQIGKIFRCAVPHWGMEVKTWVRVVAVTRHLVDICITPDGTSKQTLVRVHRQELEMAVNSGMFEEAPSTTTCPACGGRMRIAAARIQKKNGVLWACRECEETQLV
jgi:predicted RNA-binding Zn-ribbon protein involved in translation (DUF1610 family)